MNKKSVTVITEATTHEFQLLRVEGGNEVYVQNDVHEDVPLGRIDSRIKSGRTYEYRADHPESAGLWRKSQKQALVDLAEAYEAEIVADAQAAEAPTPEDTADPKLPIIRLGRPMIGHLEGTGAWQVGDPDRDVQNLIAKVKNGKRYKDGSTTVRLTTTERLHLRDYADDLADAASAAADDPSARGEIRSASAVIKKIDQINQAS